MKISNRLKEVSSFVQNNSNIIDVGCDHGLLDIYLYQNKENIFIVASDINEKPLESAKNNLIKYNLENKIKLLLSNGIENIPSNIDTIIISGMGTSNILSIIFKDKSKLNNIESIIISSNNDYYNLRKTFIDNGYYIENEKIVFENNKYYPIILFKKGYRKYGKFSLKYGPILLDNKNDIFISYLIKEKNKLISINNNLSNKYILKKIKNKLEIKRLVRIIN